MSKISGYKIALVGNPNSGKTTIFNALTGNNQLIGNWAGSTVEKKEGILKHENNEYHIIDLPGTYSISDDISNDDEKITHDFLLERNYDFVINVIDASNIERNLYLTCQLIELKIPFIIALNKSDLSGKAGLVIDEEVIANIVNTAVIKTNSKTAAGIKKIISLIANYKINHSAEIRYPAEILESIEAITYVLTDENKFWSAISILEGVKEPPHGSKKIVNAQKQKLLNIYNEDADILIAGARYEYINEIFSKAVQRKNGVKKHLTDKIDKIVLSPIYSLPIFLFVMYLLFTFSITVGGLFKDLFEDVAQYALIDKPIALLQENNFQQTWLEFIFQGLGGGIVTVASFIPLIWFLYIFLGLLENSGYMSRGALIVDRALRKIGLPGKAFAPLIIGFGCNVPAIISTRILENKKDRIIAIMMSPFMSCSARLSVYAVFCSLFFAQYQSLIVFALYLIGVAAAVFTGLLVKKLIGKQEVSNLIIELPNYNIPKLRDIIKSANVRAKDFVIGAGKLIVIIYFIVTAFGAIDSKLSYTPNINDSLLADAAKFITPAFEPIGIEKDNWRPVIGILAGTLAKEVVVGTLNALYTTDSTEHKYGFSHPWDAFCYLVFILLYFPCVSVFAAIKKELNWKWAALSAIWSTSLAYLCAAFLRILV